MIACAKGRERGVGVGKEGRYVEKEGCYVERKSCCLGGVSVRESGMLMLL